MERNSGVSVAKLDANFNKGKRADAVTPLVEGDVIILANLPEKAMIMSILLDISTPFPAGRTVDLVRINPETEATEVILTDIAIHNSGTIKISLLGTGNLNPDGTPYIGIDTVMKTSGTYNSLAVVFHGADTTDGSFKVITEYNYFDVNGTGVYLS